MACFCELTALEIIEKIINVDIPDDALKRTCCWETICSYKKDLVYQPKESAWDKLLEKRDELLLADS